MSIFRKIADKISGIERETKLINDLCEHMRQIGVNATVLNRESPEVRELLETGRGLGYIKIQGRNLDLIKVDRRSYDVPTGGPGGRSQTHWEDYHGYIMWGIVEPPHISEEREIKPIGFF